MVVNISARNKAGMLMTVGEHHPYKGKLIIYFSKSRTHANTNGGAKYGVAEVVKTNYPIANEVDFVDHDFGLCFTCSYDAFTALPEADGVIKVDLDKLKRVR